MKNYYTPKNSLLLCFFFILCGSFAFAQGASCGTATTLTVNAASITGTVSDNTVNDPAAAACAGGAISRDGWYQFTATATTATVTVESNNRQLVLYAYSGVCGSLMQISCANANTTAGGQTEVMNLTGLTASLTYYIRVVNSTNNNMTLNAVSVTVPPANDNCGGAIGLTVNPTLTCTTTTAGSTVGATQSLAAITCAGFSGNANDDVWYSFVASANTHIITVTSGAGFDAVVDIRSGACNGTNINCADATTGGGVETITASGLTSGLTYFVRIYSYGGSGNEGTFTVCVATQPVCAAPAQATAFVAGTITSTTIPATFSGSANAYLVIRSLTNTPPTQPVNGVIYSAANVGTLGSGLTFIQSSASTSINDTGLTSNTQYYYFIYAYNNTGCSGGPAYNTSGPLTGNAITCPGVPTGVNTSGIGTNNFNLNWTAPAGGSAAAITYTIQVTTDAGFTANVTGSPFTVSAPTATLNVTGLATGTTYYYRIRANNACSSSYVTGNTTTVCVAVPITYTQGFNAATLPACFAVANVAVQTGTKISFVTTSGNQTANPNEGTYFLKYDSFSNTNGGAGSEERIRTIPVITTGTVSVDVEFDWFEMNGTLYNTGAYLNEGVQLQWSTDGTTWNNSTFFPRHVSSASTAGAWSRKVITLPAGAGNQPILYVGLKFHSEYGYNCYVDHLVIKPSPSCLPPTVNAVTNLTASSVTLNWSVPTIVPANGYQYVVSTSNTTPVGSGTPAAGLSANVTSLSANTTYYVFIRSDCGAGNYSAWSASISFYTGYCSATTSFTGNRITDFVTTGGVTNITNTSSGYSAGGYGNFTAQSASQTAGGSINFIADFNGVDTLGFNIWIDWNDDLDFNDAGEKVYGSGAYVNPAAGSFTVPSGAAIGSHRMRIRADYYTSNPLSCGVISYGETEDYTFIVATPLPCAGSPTSIVANVTSSTTATISWTAANPVPANGYQYYYSTAATSPVAGTTPSGSTAAGVVSANLTGLTAGQTYYVWIRSNCGGALGQSYWTGPVTFYIPTCGVGNSTGSTTLGCPSVVSGGLGLNGLDPAPVDCTTSGCVNLEATYLQLGQTTNYTVESITYAPPYQFNCLKNPVSVNDDDVWSPIISLPFNFCFYGNTYNQCLISSNGVLTFDMTNNNPEGYSTYLFSDNLPSTNLFLNSIFGVYHDIDPSIGGQVGWELITLNTGCRALVAAWHDIPMYLTSCNSQLYTGMIVLYENTNIIDVYIEEKNVCSAWNDGNAIVGLQNASGSQAVVAPNRNGLSANWTVTNEAWRFVPSGTAITTIKWYEGAGTAGPVVGTTDVINVCPTATTTYTAEVTYTLCNGTTLKETEQTTVTVNKNKTWNGSVSTDWDTAANWTPVGVPTALNCVTIPGATPNCIVSGSAYDAYAYSVNVMNGGTLQLNSGTNLTVTDLVNVNASGQFLIKNTACLLQVNNIANSGKINMERISQPMYRYDYTYWGSPLTQASNFTLGNLSPATQPDKYYSWMPSVSGGIGNWAQESAATIMDPRKGYIVRAPQSYSLNPTVRAAYTANFIGTPNNGPILSPVSTGTMGAGTEFDKWNFLANPYPSAVNAATFLNLAANVTAIDGTIYFWTHNSPPSVAYPDPFYGDFVSNYTDADYAAWNRIGGVGTIASTGGPAPNGYIAAGQGFFVKSLVSSGNATFGNTMRAKSVSNSQFFRNTQAHAATPEGEDNFEKHRLWLNLNSNSGAFNQILVAYAEGATMDWDRGLDGARMSESGLVFYSKIPETNLVIQGRPLPFDSNDKVPLGFSNVNNDTFSMRIDHFDGLFGNTPIYIEDKLLDVIHDLKASPYVFTAPAGTFDDRFVLRYNTETLGIDNPENNIGLTAFINNGHIFFDCSANMKNITIYDVTGKLLRNHTVSGDGLRFEAEFNFAEGVYLAKIQLENGMVLSRKLMNVK